MDGDVVFEPEIIARTVELMRYAIDDDLCVASAILRTDHPAVQFEAGADCDPTVPHLWQARGRGRNLLYPEVLLESERQTPFDYGAWWFFAFSLGVTATYPPPLFGRGDDVYWGLRHMAGWSVTVNGIGVRHADFDPKNGPPSAFCESRNLPIITALAFPGFTAGELRKRVTGVAWRSILSFRYDWAAATLDGTATSLDGPRTSMSADPARTHQQVRSRYGTEVLRTAEEMEMRSCSGRPCRRRSSCG